MAPSTRLSQHVGLSQHPARNRGVIRALLCAAVMVVAMASPAAETDLAPAAFVDQVVQDSRLEAALGKLALKKSGTPAVQEFARRMIDHHDKVDGELIVLAKARGFETSPALDSMREAMVQALDSEEGASFDHVYAQRARADQEKSMELFENAARSADADVASFAKKTLPTLKEHKALARKLARQSR